MFKFEYYDNDSGIFNSMELRHDDITHDRVVERFTEFLRGCGYIFDHFAQYKLVHDDGTVEPSFEEKYAAFIQECDNEETNENEKYQFPVM